MPSRPAALRALRTTLVMPGLFALCLEGFGATQAALFAGFGSFATLVMVGFSGGAADKLRAHLGLAVAGSVLLVLGTIVSGSTALAAAVTVPVAFAVLFAGVAGPNAASGAGGALIAYVLPATSPGTLGMVPDRLAGWWLASAVGTAAVLAIPSPEPGETLRKGGARLAGALAAALDALLAGGPAEEHVDAARDARRALIDDFRTGSARAPGLSARDQALATAIELLDWCTNLVADTVREQPELRRAPAADRELVAAGAAALRDSGAALAGERARPDLDGLDARRRAGLAAARSDWDERPRDDPRVAIHAYMLATAVLAVGTDALRAARAPARRLDRGALARQASLRSVWFVNSLRGAVALAAAVAVAGIAGVAHGFWVVLGTLSVLRTRAGATGASALSALVGTGLGVLVGAALLLALGASSGALWAALPVAVLVAAYSPGAAPFVVGQAAFTVTVAILFNLLQPVGWTVGEVRVEDVALGCLISVVVGAVVWPRGVAPLVGDDLADAYRTGADLLGEAVAWVDGRRAHEPESGERALTASRRLDEAVRGLLAEQGTVHLTREELWRLIGGSLRLRLTASAIAGMPHACAAGDPAVQERANALADWYRQLAVRLGRPGRETAPLVAPAGDDGALPGPGAVRRVVWIADPLRHLAEELPRLIPPATHLAEIRRRPWWR